MLNFVCLGIVSVGEILYLIQRRNFLPSKSKAQTRARWYALFFFCYASLLRWEFVSLLSLHMVFALTWGRTIHMTTESKVWRQLIWAVGFFGTLGVLFLSLYDKKEFIYTVWLSSWGIFFCYGLFVLCRHGYHNNIEYDHLAWSTLLLMLGLIPSQLVSLYVDEYPPEYANLSILLALYLRIRLPNTWKSFVNSKKHTIEFLKKTDSVHMDHHSIYDVLNHPAMLKRYLAFVDQGVRDLFFAIDYDTSKYVSGYYSDRSFVYKDALDTIGISYSKDIFSLRKQLIDYMHITYDKKFFGNKMLFFFCPCLRPQTFTDFEDEDKEDTGVELDSPSSISSESEVVYAELRDFNSSEDGE